MSRSEQALSVSGFYRGQASYSPISNGFQEAAASLLDRWVEARISAGALTADHADFADDFHSVSVSSILTCPGHPHTQFRLLLL